MTKKTAFEILDNPVLMATIGAAQGLRGEVRVNSHTGEPLSLGDYGNLMSEDGRMFEILDLREHKTVVVVRFRGINDRNAAEALNGLNLYIDRDNLPDDDLDDEEYFYADLVGLEALDDTGNSHGMVTAVHDFGAGDILEIKAPGKRSVMIPFTETSVLEIDFDNDKMLIDPVAAGLVEDGDDDQEQDGRDDHNKPIKGKTRKA